MSEAEKGIDEAGADAEHLAASADLLAQLLLQEVEPDLVRMLRERGVDTRLEAMGLRLPDPGDRDALETLAAEYFETFVNPTDGPAPVQSLFEGDGYEGEAARSMRAIADSIGLTHDATAARGAPVDHLGSQIAMWARIHPRDPKSAREFAERHLAWAVRPLRRRRDDSFYGHLSGVVADFIDCVR